MKRRGAAVEQQRTFESSKAEGAYCKGCLFLSSALSSACRIVSLLLVDKRITQGMRQDEEGHAADSKWKTVNGTESVRENSERQTCSVGRDE